MKSLFVSCILCFSIYPLISFSEGVALEQNITINKAPDEPAAQVIHITHAYVRATPPGQKVAAIYFDAYNSSRKKHAIIAVKSEVASEASIHQTVVKNGIMKMLPVNELMIYAHDSEILQPGGYHIMLTGLKKPLLEEQSIPLEIYFADGTKLEVRVIVKS